MLYSSPEQLCFPPVAGHTLRADFAGGALSSDFGPLLLRGVDRQIGLTERLATAIHDSAMCPLLLIPCETSWPSGSIKWPRAMRMGMTPIASGTIRYSSWESSVYPWMPHRIEPVPRLSHGSNIVWTARTSIVSLRPW
jgi:hypothetical protein